MWDPIRALRQALPHRLFGRALIIIVAPVLLLQGAVTFAFFERHYVSTTRHMGQNVAGDAALLTGLAETHPEPAARIQVLEIASHDLGFPASFVPGKVLPPNAKHRIAELDILLTGTLGDPAHGGHRFSTRLEGRWVDIRVETKTGILQVLIPAERVFAGKADIFILWMVVSAVLVLSIAILFLRNQIRPIERLALAADAFGRGRAVPDFRPRGATEVRSAAQAFLTMRERIERYVQQRTEMLAAVSHDLKTPLTRMKLQLAMMGDADATPMREDIAEMEHMLDEYLDFARGEGGEAAEDTDLSNLVRETCEAALRGKGRDRLTCSIEGLIIAPVRRNGLRRCLNNLIDNALKHGTKVQVSLVRAPGDDGQSGHIDIAVDDNGPGIPATRREEAFRPFHRLDEGRNLQAGGSGLGLAIARDLARAHGGDLLLSASTMGGLRALIRLPG